MTVTTTWLDNPFWLNKDKTRIRAVRVTTDPEQGTKSTEIVDIDQFDDKGNENPDWTSIIDQLGVEGIDAGSQRRIEQKAEREATRAKQRETQKKAKELEELFLIKLKAFEIEEVKNSKNRLLKTRLRRSKNVVEVNVYTMMIIMEEIENETNSTEGTEQI